MNVISSSSPLAALSSLDQLTLLQQMFETMSIPDAVYRETVTRHGDIIKAGGIKYGRNKVL